jgi:hypothetical protein
MGDVKNPKIEHYKDFEEAFEVLIEIRRSIAWTFPL